MSEAQQRPIPGRIRNQAQQLLCRVPGMDHSGFRLALLQDASFNIDLLDRIDVEGPAVKFCAILVDQSARYPRVRDRECALAALLLAAADHAGLDLDTKLRALAQEITALFEPARSSPRLEDFLDELGLITDRQANQYALLTSAFVPPRQYEDIAATLEHHHVVFILGDPHIGKTFTAVELLWRLYANSGFSPVWVNSTQLSSALSTGSGQFENRLEPLFPDGAAVYLEDPFGSTAPIDIPEFVGNLRRFLSRISSRPRRVIITSRTYVFEKIIIESFAEYVVTLSQHLRLDTSYTRCQLIDIAKRYLSHYNPHWIESAEPEMAAKIAAALPAPHNIELFVRSTQQMADLEQVLTKLAGYRDVSSEFGRQLQQLPLWQQGFLFLVAALSSGHIAHSTLCHLFDAATEGGDFGPVDIASSAMAVDSVSNYTIWHSERSDGYLALRHPSIEEGLDRCVRSDPRLAEVVRRLVGRMADAREHQIREAALQGFLRHADLMWATPLGQRIFTEFLNAPEVPLRESSRVRLIAHWGKVPEAARPRILDYVETTWNERFQLRLILNALVDDHWRERILGRLLHTWDDWVRFRIARNVTHLYTNLHEEAAVCSLLTDPSKQIGRTAALALLVEVTRAPGEPDWRIVRLLVDSGWTEVSSEVHTGVATLVKRALRASSPVPPDVAKAVVGSPGELHLGRPDHSGGGAEFP
ncbi:hypothetical protein [Kitasatospora sp. NPDC056181]|uniref:nSTAND3 domain-containing NTPase n=1 Tax=Kitasatospora sp. NPDC056181 TaxID=3345737 RepID=UPI0035D69C63